MTLPNRLSVLIVDHLNGFATDLRDRLIPVGVQVHVVSSPTKALLMARRKKIDIAVLDYAMECATDLAAALKEHKIPIVYTAPKADDVPDAATRKPQTQRHA